MLNRETIDTIHRLHFSEHWPVRRIARHLHLGRNTVAQYLENPARQRRSTTRTSKLDPFKASIDEWLEQDRSLSAQLILERIRAAGFTGGYTIVKDYLQEVRPRRSTRAYARMEPLAGERFEVDWAHFDVLVYHGMARKLYAFCLVECHSRKMYLEFTHSQSFETFVRCHLHAFHDLGGMARELWYDNLATAVAEHDGNLVRFQPRFLAFARDYGFYPRACHRAAGWEKGKVERAIGYVRQNFWPLRTFTDLADVNRQARQWVEETANRRKHRETNQTPEERFQVEALRALPVLDADYRDTATAIVHKDLRLWFDSNRYCLSPRCVGRQLTVKADAHTVTFYDGPREIVSYPRCYARGLVIGEQKFQGELFQQMPAVERSAEQQRLLAWLGNVGEAYLRGLAQTDRSLQRQIRELLLLVRDYGADNVRNAIQRAQAAKAFGADYIANLLRQDLAPRSTQPPLRLKDSALLKLVPEPLSLLEYDALLLPLGKDSDDFTATQTGTTEPDHTQPSDRHDSGRCGEKES